MLIARAGDSHILLGLSHENLRRLKAGEPIHLTRESHGMALPAGISIVILAAETEDAIHEWLVDHGYIDKSTVMNQRRPL
jgi:hypothetical protein